MSELSTDSLPDALSEMWQRIFDCNERLSEILGSEDINTVVRLAEDRHRLIVQFFEDFPATAANAELRTKLLESLLETNRTLQTRGHRQLSEVLESLTSTQHNKKAVAAYRAQD